MVKSSEYSKHQRSKKGTVSVESVKGMLRLRWRCPHLGRQRCKSLNLEDIAVNRAVAQQRALQIQQDIATNNYDATLAKYWGDEIQHKRHLRVVELYEHFVEHKARQVGARTLEKYRGLAHHLEQFFKQQSVSSVTSTKAAAFVEKLAQQLQPITVKERLVMMKSCWEWGITQRVADDNPWAELRVKVPPKQRARPFNPTEVKAILQGFRTHAHYSYYADYVV